MLCIISIDIHFLEKLAIILNAQTDSLLLLNYFKPLEKTDTSFCSLTLIDVIV
jgi:hypothetical protein